MTSGNWKDLCETFIVIEAGRSEAHYWLDLWRYRELFRVLAWRDLSVRYKQTVIGVLWALIRPFLTMRDFYRSFSAASPNCQRTAMRLTRSWCLPASCRGPFFQPG